MTTGVFSHVRHPLYSSLMLMYAGLAMVWGVAWMPLPAFAFSAVTALVAVGAERWLL